MFMKQYEEIFIRENNYINSLSESEIMLIIDEEKKKYNPDNISSRIRLICSLVKNWSDYCWNYLLARINEITEQYCGAEHVVLYSVPEAVSFYKRNYFQSFTDLMEMPSNSFVDGCVPMFLNL